MHKWGSPEGRTRLLKYFDIIYEVMQKKAKQLTLHFNTCGVLLVFGLFGNPEADAVEINVGPQSEVSGV